MGQNDASVKYISRGQGYTLFLTEGGATLAFRQTASTSGNPSPALDSTVADQGRREPKVSIQAISVELAGAKRQATIKGIDELPGKINYFMGRDARHWRTSVPTYAKVEYASVYPGVDMVFYGNPQQLEYDFVIHPGADPRAIRLAFNAFDSAGGGAPKRACARCPGPVMPSRGTRRGSMQGVRDRLQVAANGDLVITLADAAVRFKKPVIYQPAAATAARIPVDGRYVLAGGNQVSFQLGDYDRRLPVVIDPSLVYSTYLGGSASDAGAGIAVDSAGNVYVSGQTLSVNFPVTPGVLQTQCAGGCASADAFVTKLNPEGTAVVYSTYFGGSGNEIANGIVLDSSNNVYLTGQTYSFDFPTTPGAFQRSCGGNNCASGDAFVTKLNSTGSALIYSTYLGGSAYDQANAIAPDTSGNIYVTGTTCSTNFPVTPGSFQTSYGGDNGKCSLAIPSGDAFVAKLNSTGSALVYSSYLGGSDGDTSYGIALDASNDVYLAGATFSSDFPATPGAFQKGLGAGASTAGWVAKVNPTGSALIYSTYLGGSGKGDPCDTCATAVAVDSAGNAYITGLTLEADFPTTPGAFQTTHAAGGHDAFVTKLNSAGSALTYSTFLGGAGDDGAVALTINPAGIVYVRGNTFSSSFPTTSNAFQTTFGGFSDVFVTVMNPQPGKPLIYSTYLGGSGKDYGYATASIKLGPAAAPGIYVTGYTASTNFPVSTGAFQPAYGGGAFDAFVAKLTP